MYINDLNLFFFEASFLERNLRRKLNEILVTLIVRRIIFCETLESEERDCEK